jgi:hypothetical protein
MASARPLFHARPVFPNDFQRVAGEVAVLVDRDRTDGSPLYRIEHVSRGRDCNWRSSLTPSETHAQSGAFFIAEFLGAKLKK